MCTKSFHSMADLIAGFRLAIVQFLGSFIVIAEFDPAFCGEDVWVHAK
jgi:hypothetical protein